MSSDLFGRRVAYVTRDVADRNTCPTLLRRPMPLAEETTVIDQHTTTHDQAERCGALGRPIITTPGVWS